MIWDFHTSTKNSSNIIFFTLYFHQNCWYCRKLFSRAIIKKGKFSMKKINVWWYNAFRMEYNNKRTTKKSFRIDKIKVFFPFLFLFFTFLVKKRNFAINIKWKFIWKPLKKEGSWVAKCIEWERKAFGGVYVHELFTKFV